MPSVEYETLAHVARICRRIDQEDSTEIVDSWAQLTAELEGRESQLLAPDGELDQAQFIQERVLDAVSALGRATSQADYEERHEQLGATLGALDDQLKDQRYLCGSKAGDLSFADVLLFAFLVRLTPVYFDLFKCTLAGLDEHKHLYEFGCDLFERIEFSEATDIEQIKATAYLNEPLLNGKCIVPLGGDVDWNRPHRRHLMFLNGDETRSSGIEDTGNRASGDWVRGRSLLRRQIDAREDADFPAQARRYHLFAPYNCPWSHRALLARSMKGLSEIVGASVLYFRRHPERGWQFNPKIPGCTEDGVQGQRFLAHYYEQSNSNERSAPVLWDTETNQIINNESADILRMFNRSFDALLPPDTIDLVPPGLESAIDELNEMIYQRINNGAYKAGFASNQRSYERAYHRYFSALDSLEDALKDRAFLLTDDQPCEADLRLFPTLFRHDAVYYGRFKLNQRRVADFPRLNQWLKRMLDIPSISAASNLDHARNGYFGRAGNGIVPAGPVPLGLSPSQYSEATWLGED